MKADLYYPYIHKCNYIEALYRQSETGKSVLELKKEMSDWLSENVNIKGQTGDRFLWPDWTDYITLYDSATNMHVNIAKHLYFIDTVDMVAFKLRFGV